MSRSMHILLARYAVVFCALFACVACGDDAASDDANSNGVTSTNAGTTSTNNGGTSTNNATTSTNNATTSTNNGTTASDAGDDAATNNGTTAPDVGEDVAPDAEPDAELDAELDAEPDTPPDVPDEPDEVTIAYCDCMFLNCHDVYHEVWGEDEVVARNGCLAEGSVVPRTGEAQTAGDNLECRQFYCDDGFEQPELCTAAAGLDTCTP